MNLFAYLRFAILLLVALPLGAQENADGPDGVRYVDLTPAIVTNYGGPGKLKYVKVEVSLRVDTQEAFRAVQHHLPLLRHSIVMLLGEQSDESIANSEAKEALRQQALAQVRAAMQAEEGKAVVEDLLFSTFFVQQ